MVETSLNSRSSPRIRRRKPTTRRLDYATFTRIATVSLVIFAWCWIMVTFGMVFYHGYYNKQQRTGGPVPPGAGGHDPMLPIKQRPILQPHQPTIRRDLRPYESPLLIFTCKRDTYLSQTLGDILRYIPRDCSIGCPVIVSQDGTLSSVDQVAQRFKSKFESVGIPLVHMHHPTAQHVRNSYEALAIHYGWALRAVFEDRALATGHETASPQRVLILEEDIHVASDFFDYFKATSPILDADPSLFAVSAWNDNGFKDQVQDHARVLRSDFFPGLGWMMTRKLWVEELAEKWPGGYWDDWLREPAQRQGRQVLRPEVSRTYHFGFKGGASQNQFGDRLRSILLNDVLVIWREQDLSYLQPDQFDKVYWGLLQSAQLAHSIPEALNKCELSNVRIEYRGLDQFKHFADQLQIFNDEKAGVPRTAYKGVVETRPLGKNILFIAPPIEALQRDFASVTR